MVYILVDRHVQARAHYGPLPIREKRLVPQLSSTAQCDVKWVIMG